ncbi:hypothetical protein GH5_08574 [Leishmania sp. Ghana 2012 LV757]|uniref:uncharacterized protein n=1 Tax=Leishmania sp. Ghana 2012 LV757 TaxID=2803181 RepID=UPI001B5937F0|nr:hypothetical protein GH5_08574 [Leishmania sp. Ghana 2012 LV757]
MRSAWHAPFQRPLFVAGERTGFLETQGALVNAVALELACIAVYRGSMGDRAWYEGSRLVGVDQRG